MSCQTNRELERVNGMEHKLITERLLLFEPNAHICFGIEFCDVLAIDALREAIKKVMVKYPILRSFVHLDKDGCAIFHIMEKIEPDLHVEELTEEKDWLSIVIREQKKPFALDQAPLIRFTCLRNEGQMQMVMCLHHVLADGLSCVSILKDMMFFLQNPHQVAEVQRVRLPEDSPLYDGEKLLFLPKLLVHNLNRQWRKSPLLFTEEQYYSIHHNYWLQRSHTLGTSELSSEQVSKLAAICHEHRVTINSLLLASLLKCSYQVDKRNTKASLAVSLHSDEKRFGNHASGITIHYVYDARQSIWDNAAAVQVLVKRKQNHTKHKHFFLTFLKALDAGLIDSIYFSLFGNFYSKPTGSLQKILGFTNLPLGLGTSNLGRTDLSVKDGIMNAYFIPPLVANTDKIIGMMTTDSGLKVVYQYSNQIHTKENKQIFEHWIRMLQELSLE